MFGFPTAENSGSIAEVWCTRRNWTDRKADMLPGGKMSATAATEGQISILKRMRGDRTMERRLLVIEYREATNPIAVVEKIVACQAQSDAIDRAIADEQRLRFPAFWPIAGRVT